VPDHGHAVEVGVFVTPDAAHPERVVELARVAEVAGLDLLTVQDHPYQARHLDALTLLAVVAASTSTLRVAPNVANLPLRPPAVLAQAVASLDLLSGGRVELGLGAGAFWDPIVAAGGPRLTPGESVDALEEAVAVLRAMWAGEGTVRVDGTHHRVHGLHAGPAPAHRVGIWLGAYKPRMLRVTGRLVTHTRRGREALDLMAAGAVDGLSIGFKALRAAGGRRGATRRLLEVDLWEVSVVTFPALAAARVTRVAA